MFSKKQSRISWWRKAPNQKADSLKRPEKVFLHLLSEKWQQHQGPNFRVTEGSSCACVMNHHHIKIENIISKQYF